MARTKYIPCDIYKRGITIFIGTPKELIIWSKKTFNEDEYDEKFNNSLEECSYGIADFHYGNGYAVVRLPKYPRKPEEIAYTAHELLHATIWMLEYCGVEYDHSCISNEAYTYLLEHLMRNTLELKGYEHIKSLATLK